MEPISIISDPIDTVKKTMIVFRQKLLLLTIISTDH